MAKSSRSKWKKMHRRQRTKEESANTQKRIKQLHKKLELTVKGGISAVPPQEPEKRFHFLNPELDSRVPNTRKHLNNNYRAELNNVHYDFTKPLNLAPPKTNLYGKTDVDAPHPMTVQFEKIDADAPLAGHALSKADMERLARRQAEQEREAAAAAAAATAAACAEEDLNGDQVEVDCGDDDAEEYVFGMDDTAPRRVSGKQKTHAKKETGMVAPKSRKCASSASAGAAPSPQLVEDAGDDTCTAADVAVNDNVTGKIMSMQSMRKKNGTIVSTSGSSKMKKVGKLGGTTGTRLVNCGRPTVSKTMSHLVKKKKK